MDFPHLRPPLILLRHDQLHEEVDSSISRFK
jgi:hypothetical protein